MAALGKSGSPQTARTMGSVPSFHKHGVERWDEEDLDLREIVERVEHHHAVYMDEFGAGRAAVGRVLGSLHHEADVIKRLLAAARLEHSAAVSASGGANAEEQSTGLIRQIEAELAARSLHERNLQVSLVCWVRVYVCVRATVTPSASLCPTSATPAARRDLDHGCP